jgi:tetratricopeptide (TPR) repeat protein
LSLRIRLANAYERTGLILQARGETEAALGHFHGYLEIVEELVGGRPKDLWLQRSVTVGRVHIAEVRYAQGQLAEALEGYHEFRTRSQELLDANPGNLVARHDLATAHQWIGTVLAETGKPDAALDSLGKSLAVLEEWLKDDAEDETAQSTLAATCIKLGQAHVATGQLAQAQASLHRAVELTEALTEGGSQLAEVHRLRGDAYQQMAQLEIAWAQQETTTDDARISHWKTARDWLQKRQGMLADMRKRGVSTPEDTGLLDEIASEIERCDDAIRELMPANSRPTTAVPRSQPRD